MSNSKPALIARRAFLKGGSLVLAAGFGPVFNHRLLGGEQPTKDGLRFRLVTDLHYADKPAAGTRHYRETLDKLAEAAALYEKEKPAFVVELGDLIDAADAVETELAYLKRVNKEFAAISKDRHYVLGNHCVDTLTKDEFLGGVGRDKSYYSFDSGGVHFVVLDACFRSDGKTFLLTPDTAGCAPPAPLDASRCVFDTPSDPDRFLTAKRPERRHQNHT